jgi:hypothetical protein
VGIKPCFVMQKPWEKKKNDNRRFDDAETFKQDNNHKKKAKLKPVEKNKYRMKGNKEDDDDLLF